MVSNIDYYALLGVDPASAPDEISQAYHRLARQYHPDLHPQDTDADQRFKEINEAYQALSDPERRAQYDLQRARAAQFSVDAAAAPTEPAPDDQAVVYEQSVVVHSENLEEVMDEFSAALSDAANQVADELRGAMQDFAAELDAITRSANETAGNRASRRHSSPPPPPSHGFPPPPPKGNPGRAPKPKNL